MVRLIAINFIVFLVLIIGLDFVARYIPGLNPPRISLQVNDPVLGFRPNPSHPHHDSSGWKNRSSEESVDIVALGDSQTYGINADVKKSWPEQFMASTGKTVYQMAFGGFAPSTYPLLIEEIKKKNPKNVVAAYYFGNDNVDAFILAKKHQQEKLESYLSSQTLNQDSRIADETDPDFLRRTVLDCQSPRIIQNPKSQQPENIMEFDKNWLASSFKWSLLPRYLKPVNFWYYLNHTLERYSVIYKILYGAIRWKLPLREHYTAPVCVGFKNPVTSTLLTPGYRLLGLSPTDPRIVDGEKINLKALDILKKEMEQAGIKLHVLIVPTKEFVFKNMMEQSDSDLTQSKFKYLVRLWQVEEEARQRVISHLNENNFSVVDTTSALESSLSEGKNPYNEMINYPRFGGDGHPNAIGYKVIAEEVARHLTSH